MVGQGFSGPIFVVGMPRSGTKLLRELLNRNPMIGIPRMETGFIAHMIDRFGDPPRFDDDHEFERFYEEFSTSGFYQDFLRHENRAMKKEDLDRAASRTDWGSLFEAIVRFYVPEGRAEGYLWGDKSPNYLDHIPLIKGIFPDAKFIHIIRDPRDYCLSHRKTWGRSVYRAAESWCRRMTAARADSRQLGNDYTEVFFESLLDDPELIMKGICVFLGCEFVPSMTTLVEPSENLGDAKGEVGIVRSNKGKYVTELSSSEVKRIEEIVYPVAQDLGYELDTNRFRPLSTPMLGFLTVLDTWASVRFRIKHLGFRRGLRRIFRWHSRRLRYAWHSRKHKAGQSHDPSEDA